MRILVAEPVADEGVELLRAHHQVDERHGLSHDELCATIGDYDALIVRSQVQVDAELIAAGARLAVIGRAGVGVDNVDLEAATRAGIVRTVNRQAELLLGYTRAELVGQVLEDLLPAPFLPDPVAPGGYGRSDPHPHPMGGGRDVLARRKDGSECRVDVNLSPITTPEGVMVISTIRDVTERKRLEDEVRRLAFHDPLTRLP